MVSKLKDHDTMIRRTRRELMPKTSLFLKFCNFNNAPVLLGILSFIILKSCV